MNLLILALILLIKLAFGSKDPPDYINSFEDSDEVPGFERSFLESNGGGHNISIKQLLHQLQIENITEDDGLKRKWNFETDGKIVNGYDASIIEFPHQVALFFFGHFQCGGSIISINWILTAAHCTRLSRPPASAMHIRAGSSYDNKGGTVHKIVRYIIHPRWNVENADYDFCLMLVAVPFEYSDSVGPIGLSNITPPGGTQVIVSGWGFLTADGPRSEVLQAVYLFVLPTRKCHAAFPGRITPRMFCASYPKKDACVGDSGGALIDVDRNVQVGVVSWGRSCAIPELPGVYSNVVSARPWIHAVVGF